MKKTLFELFIVLPVAILVFVPLSLLGVIYTLFKHLIKLDYKFDVQMFPIFRSFNLALDGFANATAGELLNDAFKVQGNIRYGKWYQTISAVTGLRYVFEGKNTWLRKFLNKIDKDHCEKVITPEDKFYWESKNG